MQQKTILRIQGISKSFGGVKALKDVSLEIVEGECHALVGENGAGKTTLINILNGAIRPDAGVFEFDGKNYDHSDPSTSLNAGIGVIHQEVALVETLSVMENIFLSRLKSSLPVIVKSPRQLKSDAERLLQRLGVRLNPQEVVETLSTSKKQVVEIAKALSSNPKLLIMDEPTSALTKAETEKLFSIIRTLKETGISIIFVSHRLNEVMEISDRVTVLRDGQYIGTAATKGTSIPQIIQMMVGREVELYEHRSGHEGTREKTLEVDNLTSALYFTDVSFYARKGEILGISGLVGAGRTELAQAIFGFLPVERGTVKVHGKVRRIRSPKDAMAAGIGMLPEDRKVAATIAPMSVRENISIALLPRLASLLFVRAREEKGIVEDLAGRLRIKTANIEENIGNLSGGNQQKTILARWLGMKMDVLIVDEPTQGVDVGAKAEIHKLLRDLAKEGIAVIVISSDLPEILGISDRVLVMRSGRIVGEFDSSEATAQKIMTLATVGGERPTNAQERQP